MSIENTIDQSYSQLERFYATYYLNNKHDSPDDSRTSMARRIFVYLSKSKRVNVLNIGSGPQALETQLLTRRDVYEKLCTRFYTVDFAPIRGYRLLARGSNLTRHVRANGCQLPFVDNHFNLVVSNHAIDFMPPQALREACRVLSSKGHAIFYFHHSDLIPPNLDLDRVRLNPMIKMFWEFLRTNKILFESPDQIVERMALSGFKVEDISLNSDYLDKWWEVKLRKNGKI